MSSSSPPSSGALECFFLGTATSTGLPLTACLTLTAPYPPQFEASVPLPTQKPSNPKGSYDPNGKWPSNIPCCSCRSSVDPDVPDGRKNTRGNTSMIIRKQVDGVMKNILVDCGKTFGECSRKWFPVWGVKTIDAVILTHGHADAYFGLDDLREWCMRLRMSIPIYLNQATYETVGASFPYLIDKTQASGGGDVPSLKWNIIPDISQFTIHSLSVQSFPVHHGIYFRPKTKSPIESKHIRDPHHPITKQSEIEKEPLICLGFIFDEKVIYMSDVSDIPERSWDILDRYKRKRLDQPDGSQNGRPELSNVWTSTSLNLNGHEKLQDEKKVPSVSEESSIARQLANISLNAKNDPASKDSKLSRGSKKTEEGESPLILITDILWPIKFHISHYNLAQALITAMRLNPTITYGTGFVHPVTHFMWEEIGLSIRGLNGRRDWHPDHELSQDLIERIWNDRWYTGTHLPIASSRQNGINVNGRNGSTENEEERNKSLGQRVKEWGGRVEPAYDGLSIVLDGNEWKEVEYKGIYM